VSACLEVWPLLLVSPLEKELGCESVRFLDVLVPWLAEPSTHTDYVANSLRIGAVSKWDPHCIQLYYFLAHKSVNSLTVS